MNTENNHGRGVAGSRSRGVEVHGSRLVIAIVITLIVLVVAIALSLSVGKVAGGFFDPTVMRLRLFRLAAGLLAGATLAVSGVLMQGLFRNPLASPSVAGVTAGAALGAQLALLMHGLAGAGVVLFLPREFWLPVGGFAGALAALLVLLALVRRTGSDLTQVLLIGMVLSILCGSLSGFVLAIGNNSYELGRALVAFGLGGLDASSPATLVACLPLALLGLGAAYGWGRPLDLMLSGETEARALGVDVEVVRRWVLAWTALLATTAVVLGGGVSFVCLVVPNLLRAWIGPAHRPLVVLSALGGAAFLTLADACARIFATASGEIPLAVITGLVGAPFFLWFFRRERHAGRI